MLVFACHQSACRATAACVQVHICNQSSVIGGAWHSYALCCQTVHDTKQQNCMFQLHGCVLQVFVMKIASGKVGLTQKTEEERQAEESMAKSGVGAGFKKKATNTLEAALAQAGFKSSPKSKASHVLCAVCTVRYAAQGPVACSVACRTSALHSRNLCTS